MGAVKEILPGVVVPDDAKYGDGVALVSAAHPSSVADEPVEEYDRALDGSRAGLYDTSDTLAYVEVACATLTGNDAFSAMIDDHRSILGIKRRLVRMYRLLEEEIAKMTGKK